MFLYWIVDVVLPSLRAKKKIKVHEKSNSSVNDRLTSAVTKDMNWKCLSQSVSSESSAMDLAKEIRKGVNK